MKKKAYLAPTTDVIKLNTVTLLVNSTLDTQDENEIIPTDDPFDGEFKAPVFDLFKL